MKVIASSLMFKINQDKCYFSNDIQGNFIILTTLDKAMRFKTEEDAKKFIKEHKAGKNNCVILDCED